jgi:uncharacterized membrane protein
MLRRMGWLGKVLVLLVCMGYPWLVHSAYIAQQPAPLRLALAMGPLFGLCFWLITLSRGRTWWPLVLLLAGAAVYIISLQDHWSLMVAYGLPHAAINLTLLGFFGRTLVRGREPLITRLARRLHGTLAPDIEAYTRNVTIAWCVFFAAQVLISILLFQFTAVSVWLTFISFFTFPMLTLMFVGEYIYRGLRHRNHPRVSILKTIQVFTQDVATAKSADVR